MDGRGVAKLLPEIRAHGLEHLGQKRSCRVIVEVNPAHRNPPPFYGIIRTDVAGLRLADRGSLPCGKRDVASNVFRRAFLWERSGSDIPARCSLRADESGGCHPVVR